MKNTRKYQILAALFVLASLIYVFRPESNVFQSKVTLTALDSNDGWSWVTVANDDPIKNGNHEFKRGETCVVNYTGAFGVEAHRAHHALARYTNPDGKQSFGTECANGTLFALSNEQVTDLYAKNKKFTADQKENIQLVTYLTEYPGNGSGRIRPTPSFGWVRVENHPGVNSGNGFHEYSSSCSLFDNNGPFYVLGTRQRDGAKLVRYDGPQGLGAQCGTGTLFWAK